MEQLEDATNGVRLVITGKPIGRRFEVIINEQSVFLSGTSFYYLFRLSHHAVTVRGGYLQHSELDSGDNHIRYIYRLRQELKANQVDSLLRIENDKNGGYRLLLSADHVSFDIQMLVRFPDARIQALAQQLNREQLGVPRQEAKVGRLY
jgi:hypothetical protein